MGKETSANFISFGWRQSMLLTPKYVVNYQSRASEAFSEISPNDQSGSLLNRNGLSRTPVEVHIGLGENDSGDATVTVRM